MCPAVNLQNLLFFHGSWWFADDAGWQAPKLSDPSPFSSLRASILTHLGSFVKIQPNINRLLRAKGEKTCFFLPFVQTKWTELQVSEQLQGVFTPTVCALGSESVDGFVESECFFSFFLRTEITKQTKVQQSMWEHSLRLLARCAWGEREKANTGRKSCGLD